MPGKLFATTSTKFSDKTLTNYKPVFVYFSTELLEN